MNTIIIYATKYGATAQVAGKLSAALGGGDLRDIGENASLDLSGYDCIVLGGPLTAGKMHKSVREFAKNRLGELMGKRVGLFVAGLSTKEEKGKFETNFPHGLIEAAAATAVLGGIYDPEKCGAIARRVMKAVVKSTEYTSTVDEERIAEFAKKLKG